MSAPGMQLVAACAALEYAVNEALKQDTASREKLAALAPGVVSAGCEDPELTVYLRLGQPLAIRAYHEGPVDGAITGQARDWLELLGNADKAAGLINSALTLQGDSQIFVELGKIAEQLDIDWEGHLASLIGDVPAHLTGSALRGLHRQGLRSAANARRTLDEFVHEELRILPSRAETEEFYDQLRQLEMRIDRAAARLKRIRRQSGKGS